MPYYFTKEQVQDMIRWVETPFPFVVKCDNAKEKYKIADIIELPLSYLKQGVTYYVVSVRDNEIEVIEKSRID